MNQSSRKLRAPRWPTGLVPWRKTVERFLEAVAAAVGVQIEVIGAVRTQGEGSDSLSFELGGTGAAASPSSGLYVSTSGVITPSTILLVMPTIGGDALDEVPAPALTIPSSGTRYVVVTVTGTPDITTLSGRDFNSGLSSIAVSIALQETAPSSGDAASSTGTHKFLLATFVDGVKTSQVGYGPIGGGVNDNLTGTGVGVLSLTWTAP